MLHIIQQIDSNMTISVKPHGLVTCFNGMDIIQTKHCIKLHCASYIWKVLATHDWFHDGVAEDQKLIPMLSNNAYLKKLDNAVPPESESVQLQL